MAPALLVLALPFVLAGPPPARTRIAVIATGPDALAAGAAQAAVESTLRAEPSLDVVPAERIAAVVCPRCAPERPALDAALQAQLAAQIEAAANAFYDAEFDASLEALANAEGLTRGTRYVPVKDRITIHLWRATVFQAQRNTGLAEAQAAAALALDPQLQVDLGVFRPSVKELVDQLRATVRAAPITLTIGGAPAQAAVRVDDRPVPGAVVRVAKGRHWIEVAAPGFRTALVSVELAAPARIDVPLAPALPAALAELATRALGGAKLSRAELDPVNAIAGAVLFVAPRADGGYEAALVRDGRVTRESVPGGGGSAAALSRWISSSLPRGDGGVTVRGSAGPGTLSITAHAALASPTRVRLLEGHEGQRVEMPLVALGPAVHVEIAKGWWLADARLAWASHFANVEVAGPAETTQGGAGSVLEARAAFAGLFTFGRFRIGPHGAVSFERLALDPVEQQGRDLALFNGHQRIGFEIGARARTPFVADFSLDSSAGVSVGHFREDPAGASGDASLSMPGIELEVALSKPAGPWIVGGGWAFSTWTVVFEGPGDAPLDPPLENATLTESVHRVSVFAGRRF